MTVRINPSILSADFANFQDELETITNADLIHVDVMDNHFVPNLTFGLGTVKRLQEISNKPLDVHLMITDVDRWALDYAALGVFSVTFHAEASSDALALAAKLRKHGCRAGIALKPNSAIEPWLENLSQIDQLLVMTVEPGFGGQALIESTLSKVAKARVAIDAAATETWLQVDGGISSLNIARVSALGADTFVAGSAVFGASNRNSAIEELRALAIDGKKA